MVTALSYKKALSAVSAIILALLILPTGAEAASVLEPGAKSDAVKALQSVLKQEGFYTLSIDGNYGSGTVSAVKEYQKKNSLTADGKAGTKTLTAMGLLSDAEVIQKGVTTGAVNLRRGASTSYITLYQLIKGTALSILGSSGDWYRVRTGDGIEGYVSKNYIQTEDYTVNKVYEGKVINVSSYLNIRADKSSSSDSIGRLTNGSIVYVLEKGTWVKIQTSTGIVGYCYSDYILVTDRLADPDVSVTIPDYTLKRGMNNNADVRRMQERLKELGYLTGSCDGNFGSITYSAVVAFQKRNGLTADGIAGQKTLTALYSSGAVAQGDQNGDSGGNDTFVYPVPSATLRQGQTSSDVKTMQTRLTELKYFSGSCTGYFGSKTLEAVKAFQKANGLTVDGIAGSKTLTAMYSAKAEVNGGMSPELEARIDAMIEHAKGYLGVKYVLGGNGPTSFDCSGLTTAVFKESMGYTLPRTAYTQGYNDFGRKITDMSALVKGDLVLFNTNANDGDLCDHVGIYIGNGQFIHASSSERKVIISNITDRWWAEIFSWGKRVFE